MAVCIAFAEKVKRGPSLLVGAPEYGRGSKQDKNCGGAASLLRRPALAKNHPREHGQRYCQQNPTQAVRNRLNRNLIAPVEARTARKMRTETQVITTIEPFRFCLRSRSGSPELAGCRPASPRCFPVMRYCTTPMSIPMADVAKPSLQLTFSPIQLTSNGENAPTLMPI